MWLGKYWGKSYTEETEAKEKKNLLLEEILETSLPGLSIEMKS